MIVRMKPVVEHGWFIIDARGRKWDGHRYPTKAAAEATASRCIAGGYTIRPGRVITRPKAIPGGLTTVHEVIVD